MMQVNDMTSPMRATLLTAVALMAGASPMLAQSGSAGGGGAARATVYRCESCTDSLRRVFVTTARLEREKLEKRLRELEAKLDDDDLGRAERNALVEELANLTLRLSEMGTRFAVEFAPGFRELTPVVEGQVRRELARTREAMMQIQPHDVLRRFAPKGWLGINVNGHPQEI